MNEADTCCKYVLKKLTAAHWDEGSHFLREQRTFTDGRIVPTSGNKAIRKKQKRADYLLGYTKDFLLAVVEAKADYKKPGAGMSAKKTGSRGACLPPNC